MKVFGFFFAVFFFLGIGVFFGCDFSSENDGSSLFSTEKISVDGSGDLYFVKSYNKDTDTDIASDKTGYISAATERNSSADESCGVAHDFYIHRKDLFLEDNFRFAPEDSARSGTTVSEIVSAALQECTVGTKKDLYISYNDVFKRFTAQKRYEGTHCYIWYIDNTDLTSFTDSDFEDIAGKFDSIYELETEILGSNNYDNIYSNIITFPSSGKVNIVVADIAESAYDGMTAGTYGYFYSADFFSEGRPYSNKDEIIYIDSYFYKKTQDGIYSTIVHEFNHLLNFVGKAFVNKIQQLDDSFEWYTEMLSAISEDMFQDYLGIVIDESESYLQKIENKHTESVQFSRLPFFINYSYLGFSNWRSNDKKYVYVYDGGTKKYIGDVFASYGNVYAFGAYLVRNYRGFELLKKIATNGYVCEESITHALADCGYSKTFDDVFNDFYKICVNTSGSSSDISLNKKIVYSMNSNVFFPAINIDNYVNENYAKSALLYMKKSWKEDCGIVLGARGFSIHYVGPAENYSSISISRNDSVDYFTFYK